MPERIRSLHVYRLVTNIDSRLFAVALTAAMQDGIETPEVSGAEFYSTILSPGELRAALEPGQPTRATVERLGDYLGDHVPQTFDDYLPVPTFPVTSFSQRRFPNRHAIAIGTQNATVRAERATTQALVRAGLGMPELNFPENDYLTYVQLGRFSPDVGGVRAAAFRDFLQSHPGLLPAEIILGPVSIDDIQ